MGAFVPSLKVNALDLSPNYAGTLMALVGGIGAISGIITPYLVGVLTPNVSIFSLKDNQENRDLCFSSFNRNAKHLPVFVTYESQIMYLNGDLNVSKIMSLKSTLRLVK